MDINQHKTGPISLISDTLDIFSDKPYNTIQMFCAAIFLGLLYFALSHYVFLDVAFAIHDQNFRSELKNISIFKITAYLIFFLLFKTLIFITPLALVFSHYNNIKYIQGLKNILKRIIPISFSYISFFYIFTILLFNASLLAIMVFLHVSDFGKILPADLKNILVDNSGLYILVCIIGTISFFLLFILPIQGYFYNIINILENKYAFKSIARSASYTKNHLLAISFKPLIAWIFFALLGTAISNLIMFILDFILPQAHFEKSNMNKSFYIFFLSQLYVAICYVLYHDYKLTKINAKSESNYRIILILLSIIGIAAIGFLSFIIIKHFNIVYSLYKLRG